MTKTLALGYTTSDSFQLLYQGLIERFERLPLKWESPYRLKGLFFAYRLESAVEELITQIQNSYPQDIFPLDLEFEKLLLTPSVYAPKNLCVRAKLPIALQKYLKELSKTLKRSLSFNSPYFDLSLAKVDKSKLKINHIEALLQSIHWKESLNQLVLLEKTKGFTQLLYEFQNTAPPAKKRPPLPRSFLRAP